MYCSKCGATAPNDSAFCTTCGNPLSRTAVAPVGVGGNPPAPYVPPNVGVAGYSLDSHRFRYASFWARLVAYLIDGLLMGLMVLVIFVPLAGLTGMTARLGDLHDIDTHGQPSPAVIAAIISIVLMFVLASILVSWLYEAYFMSSNWQATLGKRAMSIYVTDVNGQPISFLHATGRHFAKIVSGLVPLALGFIMAGFTERRQALHDMIASTLVLQR